MRRFDDEPGHLLGGDCRDAPRLALQRALSGAGPLTKKERAHIDKWRER